jgi:type IV secretion system protein VirB5
MNFADTIRALVMKRPDTGLGDGGVPGNDKASSGGGASGGGPGRKRGGENPYLNARRTWNDQAAANIASRQMWQIVGVLSLLIALSSVAGMIIISKQAKVIPYLVEVDKLGNLAGAGVAQQVGSVDPRIMKALLGQWITNIRMVTPDTELQRKAIFKVYAMLHASDPAFVKANEFLNGDEAKNPFARAATQLVNADVDSLLQQSASSWQVEWTETTRDRNGNLLAPPVHWRGLLTVAVVAPSNDAVDKQLLDNPLGIYIKDVVWTAVK